MKTIDIFGVIGEEWDGLTSRDIAKQLEGLEPGKDEVLVRINSPGGFAYEGIAIYNMLKPYNPEIQIVGLAASAASVVAMAGESRHIATGAEMMIHNAWGLAVGSGKDMFAYGEHLKKLDSSLADIYATRTGDREKAVEVMDAETWLSAQESVAMGFATHMDEEAATKPPENSMAVLLAMGSKGRAEDSDKSDEQAAEQLKFEAKRRRAKSLLERHRKGLKSVSIPK